MSKTREVCRVCLDSKHSKFKALHVKYKNIVLYEFINIITNLKIKLNDGFPDKICHPCYIQLKTIINFKEKCEATDVILKSKTVKLEVFSEEKVKTEDPTENAIKIEYLNDDHFDCAMALDSEEGDIQEEKSKEYFVYHVPHFNNKTNSLEHKANFKSRAINLNVECHDCGGKFKSKCKLKVHWKKTHMLSSLICPQCKRAFKSFRAFHLHRKKMSKSCSMAANKNVDIEGEGKTRMFICKQCKYKSKRVKDMMAHIVVHTGDRPYKCNLCTKTYTQLSSLQGHQETAHQKYIMHMTCHYCGKLVKGRRKVHRHLRSHTKVDCPVCSKSISALSYVEHMKRHSGVKSYACEVCAATFYTIAELCNHKRLVHSKKTYKCDLCEFTTVKENGLKNHRSRHTSNNIPCTTCGRFFLTAEKLALHERTHYTEKQFSCPHCETRFFKRDSVRRHLKVKHSMEDLDDKEVTPKVKTEAVCIPQTEGNEEVEDSESQD